MNQLQELFPEESGLRFYHDGSGMAEVKFRFSVFNPFSLKGCESAARELREIAYHREKLEAVLKGMGAYEKALMERYQILATAPHIPFVSLQRETRFGITYVMKTGYLLPEEDNYFVVEHRESYSGKERAKAIRDFKGYVKNHPGIKNHLDLELSSHEKAKKKR